MPSYQKLVEQLIAQNIDKTIVNELIKEYRETKRQYRFEDYEKTILHAGKFVELTLAFIKNYVKHVKVNINNIYFNKLLNEIMKYTKTTEKDEILTLAIPRTAQSIYTIRNKKRVAHVKAINPDVIDSSFCVSACDWILSELALLFYTSDPKEANELINSILEKKVPLIEEFENGSIVILHKGLSMKEELALTLYHYYPKKLSNEDLIKLLKSKKIYNRLYLLENERLIHRTKDGSKLTRLGIKYVEDEILSKKT